jgi:Holliday junction resolvase
MLESSIQTKIKKKLESQGYLVIKLVRTSCNGIPDLMCLKDGKTIFIEVKQPTGVLSELQKLRIKQLTDLGFDCKVWTDYECDFMLKN